MRNSQQMDQFTFTEGLVDIDSDPPVDIPYVRINEVDRLIADMVNAYYKQNQFCHLASTSLYSMWILLTGRGLCRIVTWTYFCRAIYKQNIFANKFTGK